MNDIRDADTIDDISKNQSTFYYTYFKDFEKAKEYAMKNPGSTFVKNHNGPGYMLKWTNVEYIKYKHHQKEIKLKDNVKHGRPALSGISWGDQEIAKLIKLHSSGQNIHQISSVLERSFLAVSAKLSNLDLISKEEHQKNLDAHSSTLSY